MDHWMRERVGWERWLVGVGLLVALALISLYPYTGWVWPASGNPFAFLFEPPPRYRTSFDLWTNLLAYLPLGAVWANIFRQRGVWRAVLWATLIGLAWSLSMEATQSFLPNRRAQWLDLLANGLGALLGATGWALMARRLRQRAAIRRAHVWGSGPISLTGATGLTLLWLFAQAAPTPLWLAFGDILPLELAIRPFGAEGAAAGSTWPLGEGERIFTEASLVVCALLGLAIHLKLGLSGQHRQWLRQIAGNWAWVITLALLIGVGSRMAWVLLLQPHPLAHDTLWVGLEAWFSPGVQVGLLLVALLGAAVAFLGPLGLCGLGMALALLLAMLASGLPNADTEPNVIVVLAQGQWINLRGLAAWAAALWPFVSMGWLALWLLKSRRTLRR
ncbi:MAG: VanZ family protein [Burkholderiaceae bacterium]